MKELSITTDIVRKLPSKAFVEGANITVEVSRDSVFKAFIVSLTGSIVTTFASGTPVADDTSLADRIINSIKVVSNGSTTIKNVTPWFMHVQNLMANSIFGNRRCSAGAAAVAFPTVDAIFTFGTTTQITSVQESFTIFMENVLAGKGRMSTLWDTRGLSSAEINISCGSFANILGYGNTAPVVWSSNLFSIGIETVELQNVPLNAYFSQYKQTTKEIAFTAAANDFLVDINRGNFLQGIMLQARDGAAGTATTATGRVLSNTLVTDLKLIINGTRQPKNTTFQELQNRNKSQYGLNVPYSSNKSVLDGIAYMDLLNPSVNSKFGDLQSAQDCRAPLVDQVQLAISTNSAATYTATAKVAIMTNEVVAPINS